MDHLNLTSNSISGRPTWAEIDLERLCSNFRSIRTFCGDDIAYMAVIKADAYGHGAAECGAVLASEGVDWFAVATMEEGIGLRSAGISTPILILGGIWPGQEGAFLEFRLTPIIFNIDQARMYDSAAKTRVPIHVKIDTGMNRVGFRPEHVEHAAANLASLQNVYVDGVMTHFAVDDELSETAFTSMQLANFAAAVSTFVSAGYRPTVVDIANSPGAIAHPSSRLELIRIGGLLFGITEDVLPRSVKGPELAPVMSLFTRIAMIKTVPKGESVGYGRTFFTERESRIATVPIGYNDGYDRGLSNRGEIIVRGRKAPVVGRISMDWTTIDVTDIPGSAVGDIATVIGPGGDESIRVEDIARKIDTISYEVTCGIAARVPRFYKG